MVLHSFVNFICSKLRESCTIERATCVRISIPSQPPCPRSRTAPKVFFCPRIHSPVNVESTGKLFFSYQSGKFFCMPTSSPISCARPLPWRLSKAAHYFFPSCNPRLFPSGSMVPVLWRPCHFFKTPFSGMSTLFLHGLCPHLPSSANQNRNSTAPKIMSRH